MLIYCYLHAFMMFTNSVCLIVTFTIYILYLKIQEMYSMHFTYLNLKNIYLNSIKVKN